MCLISVTIKGGRPLLQCDQFERLQGDFSLGVFFKNFKVMPVVLITWELCEGWLDQGRRPDHLDLAQAGDRHLHHHLH